MKLTKIFLLCGLFSICQVVAAKKQTLANRRRTQMSAFIQLRVALQHSKSKQFSAAARQLFLLVNNPTLKKQKNKIRYHLASSLYNMGLYHPAVSQLQILVNQKDRGYIRRSLQKIASVAALLKDDQLLNYTIAHGGFKYISRSERQKLHYHFGDFWMRRNKFS